MQDIRFRSKENQYDPARVSNVCAALGVSPVFARALLDRGVTSKNSAVAYLHPTEADLHDPMELPDIRTAVQRILTAIAKNERICIYGDYDTDGVCATSILYKQLKRMGATVQCYVPSRHEDGYGMHSSVVETLCEYGIDLIVTVDNGITALEEIRLCNEFGIDVIVTDHHLPAETLPECTAVVAASRKDSAYPYPYLCGAAVAFKLACALSDEIDEELLALAAVATIADIVPLTGENRTIVRLGLPHLRRNIGLAALLDVSGAGPEPDAQTVAFTVSPRLNAAGRMGDAGRAISLLTATDTGEATGLADILQNENDRRREEEARVVSDIRADFPEEELAGKKIIIVRGADWNPGVLGIVASKMLEQYYRPVILFTVKNGELVGSGRSIPGIDLHGEVSRFSELFVKFGGHERAVGITIAPENFEAFRTGIEDAFDRAYDASMFVREFSYEQRLPLSDATPVLANELRMLAPFGEGNPEPVFLGKDVTVKNAKAIGKNREHVNGTVSDNGAEVDFVAFRSAELLPCFENGHPKDLLFRLQANTFRGRVSAQLNILSVLDSAETPVQAASVQNKSAFLRGMMYNEKDFSLTSLFESLRDEVRGSDFGRDAMQEHFRALREICRSPQAPETRFSESNERLAALAVFLELGFFRFSEGRLCECPQVKKQLTDSGIYRSLIR
ncbi:MAG: single-stranded-DNA-specific exonuclease RecJ [Clostridia bacterium]|nr:single-stranded-DNA-specific exonuclease RecJ [Clostridia bacterium]